MAKQPALPWNLRCTWCSFYIVVNARGQRGSDPGAGVEAADAMEQHVVHWHGRSWADALDGVRVPVEPKEREE